MVKQGSLLVLTFLWDQIIGCNGEARLFARADHFVGPDIGCNGEIRLSAHADPSVIPDHWL